MPFTDLAAWNGKNITANQPTKEFYLKPDAIVMGQVREITRKSEILCGATGI